MKLCESSFNDLKSRKKKEIDAKEMSKND